MRERKSHRTVFTDPAHGSNDCKNAIGPNLSPTRCHVFSVVHRRWISCAWSVFRSTSSSGRSEVEAGEEREEGEERGCETSKTKPTCLITAWGSGWGEQDQEEGSPTEEGEEEAAEGKEVEEQEEEVEMQLSPQV